MGNVRSEQVKRSAHELIKRFPDRFSMDFEKNKKLVSELAIISSSKLRNRIAGYLTSLICNTLDSTTLIDHSMEEEDIEQTDI